MVFLTHSAALLLMISIMSQTAFHHCQNFESGSGDIESGRIGSGPHICNDSSVRLVNGTAPYNGRLEVCNDDAWGTVCNVSFSLNDGHAVCKQLGFFGAVKLTDEFGPGTGDTIWLSDVDCQRGTERSLSDCAHAEFFCGPYNCQPCHHYRDVGVICRPHKDTCEKGDIRLAVTGFIFGFTLLPLEGLIVELCTDGIWTTMNGQAVNDPYLVGKVVCRHLGYTGFHDAFTGVFYGLYKTSSGFNVNCFGNETNIYDCDLRSNELGRFTSASIFSESLFVSCYDLQIITNSTTVQLGPDMIEETVNFTCIANINEVYYWERFTNWFFEDEQQLLGYYQYKTPNNISNTLQIINPRKSDEGAYHCSFGYDYSYYYYDYSYEQDYEKLPNFNQIHFLELKAKLSINVSEVNRHCILIQCELTGYLSINNSAAVDIEWFRENNPIQPTNGLYNVTISNNSQNRIITGEGIKVPSIISTLHIYTTDVAGNYSCTVLDGNSSRICENISLKNYEHTTNDTTTESSQSTSTKSTTNINTSTNSISSSTSMNWTTEIVITPASGLSDGSVAVIAVGLIVFIMLICCAPLIIVCVLLLRRRQSKNLNLQNMAFLNQQFEMSENLNRTSNTGFQRAKLRELHLSSCVIDKSNLKLMEKIGQGEFGIVYRAVYRNNELSPMSVAVKTVKGLYTNSRLVNELLVEADKMKSFDHLHVLSLIGICVGLLESPCIVMPFMSNGSLLSYLRREANDLIINEIVDENVQNSVLKHLLSICLQVAKGMDYLTQQKFIHRDLAARNCMISSDGIIKIADFGLAEDVYTTVYFKTPDQDSDESVKLPLKWMALESIHLGKYDEKTDVWSYGVLCWEVFNGGKTPYPGSTPKEIVTMLDNGERLSKPTNAACTEEVYSIMMSCWENSPTCRPHFFELVESINGLLVPLADYMDLASDYLKAQTISQ